MKKWVFLLPLFLLSACDKPIEISLKQPEAQTDAPQDRWAISPAGKDTINGHVIWTAWRLNVTSGVLDFCTYDEEGMPATKAWPYPKALGFCSIVEGPRP